ncbi:MAG: hypothetical protein ABI912_02900 [Actinomycetota bacterium]
MSRINDVGGVDGFGPVDIVDDAQPFHDDWEAHVFAMNGALIAKGVYNLDEFRDAVEQIPPRTFLATSYYERWFMAIRALLVRKGVVTPEEIDGVLAG